MKKFATISSLVLAAGLTIGSLVSCGGAAKPADNKLVVGLSLPTQREERWVRDKDTMIAEAKALGVDLKVQVSDTDMAMQISQVESLITQGVKVLILAPHDGAAAAPLVEKAHKAGIKVISYDRLILNSDVDLYLSFDNVKVGEIQGKYITEKAPKGNYIVMSGAPSDNNAALFKEGAMKYIKPLADKGDIKIVAEQGVADWLPANAQSIVENALSANDNKVDAILAPNDGTAGGAIQALKAKKLDGKVPITGQDSEVPAIKRIVEGTQSMTVYKDTRELGKAAIALAKLFAEGKSVADVSFNGTKADQKVDNKKIQVPSLLLTPLAVTKDNYEELLVKSGYIKAEDLK